MVFVEQNKRIFAPFYEHLYKRLSVRECVRIQTFPDEFIFKYEDVADGYKLVGECCACRVGVLNYKSGFRRDF
jgi:DNA (cytosine-5)-methyltransferase 1